MSHRRVLAERKDGRFDQVSPTVRWQRRPAFRDVFRQSGMEYTGCGLQKHEQSNRTSGTKCTGRGLQEHGQSTCVLKVPQIERIWEENQDRDFFIESKRFSFNLSNSSIHIRESKHGVFSEIELDLDGAMWLIESLKKLVPGKSLTNKFLTIIFDSNHFGGLLEFFRVLVLCLYRRAKRDLAS
ncbi:unnamed protein product [Cuscuta epithymum]|uniref:Uncharacterized protein n=1 Tax=Cuscuta epithymum TaxID=186058 RepID=A0AAV0DWB6_9ASTE|nr:unnamed protein product [Cuscuta epithymum]